MTEMYLYLPCGTAPCEIVSSFLLGPPPLQILLSTNFCLFLFSLFFLFLYPLSSPFPRFP